MGGVTLVNISIDAATNETYKIMRNSNKFDLVERNVKKFVDLRNKYNLGLPQIRLSFCKTYANSDEEKLFIEKWYNCVDQIDVQNYISTVGEFNELDKGSKIETQFCKDPFRRVGILCNGDVQCCCCSFGHSDIIIGNIYETSMQEIWNGESMKKIQNAYLNNMEDIPEYCKVCLNSRYSF